MDSIREFFSFFDGVPFIRAAIAIVLVFFLPGFAWTAVLIKKIDIIERLALSFGLSIVLVIISILILNLAFGVNINEMNALLVIIVITVIPGGIFLIKKLRRR